ncbi:MAG: OmpA family protein, partial [Gammaproteobacteria bacterium]|nr:OmpA family protein [Gammaproteobacteria bacterium]
ITDQATTTANITPAALILSGITADNKVYNADVDATVVTGAAVYSGLLASDVVSVTVTGSFDSKNVGTVKMVTLVSSYTGLDTGNYYITDQSVTTADITPKSLIVSGIIANDKVFDGNAFATLDVSDAVYSGLVNGDDLELAISGEFVDSNVGIDKEVSLVSSYSGGDVNNYSITSQENTVATILPSSNENSEENGEVVIRPPFAPILKDGTVPQPGSEILNLSTISTDVPLIGTPVSVYEDAAATNLTSSESASTGQEQGIPRDISVTTEVDDQDFLKVRNFGEVEIVADELFEYQLPGDTFIHSNEDALIDVDAKLTDGSPLPEWISFDQQEMKFVAKPPLGFRSITVLVAAQDKNGHSVETSIKINVIDLLKGVNFETASAKLHPDSNARLDVAVDYLKKNSATKVMVAGHTDDRGDATLNLNLSQKRARAVLEYFISKGVSPTQVTAKGFGKSDPVADNSTKQGRLVNRRVELRLQK